jgi:solute carrier family 13 (sodium-dependent dicarboxylate transporter), member 2/3/5
VWPGLLAGPVLAVLVYSLLPDSYVDGTGSVVDLPLAARKVAAIATLMAVWWMTEAISVYATALVPLALFPLLGVADIKTTAVSYGSPVVYLFLGGFILALALERWNLHRRLALNVLAVVGASPRAIIGAFMFVAATLSMWVTNTAATIMLLPVAVSVINLLPDKDLADGSADSPFSICLLLGIAYAASIGGMGTIIGTAPNVFVVSFINEQLNREIGFLEWMRFAVPVVIVFVPLVWLLLTRFIYRVPADKIAGAGEVLRGEQKNLQDWGRGEVLTLIIFVLTAAAWVTRPLLNQLEIAGQQPLAGLTDAGIAICAALILFLCPVNLRQREFLMDWDTAARLPWGLLILFGGGLALAAQLSDSGFSAYLGQLAGALNGLPVWVIVLAATSAVVFLTELTSNTATTATLVPVFLALALGLGLPPLILILPATLAASCAFMLPVATPPNAVVFGSGYLRVRQMSRAGFWLNLVAIALITLATWIVILPSFGIVLPAN